jgi:hypothetical protein
MDTFSKLFLDFSFGCWPEERPVILLFVSNLSIIEIYIFAIYYTLKPLRNINRKTRPAMKKCWFPEMIKTNEEN